MPATAHEHVPASRGSGHAALARFFAGPPLPFVTAWRHAVTADSGRHDHESIEIVLHHSGCGAISTDDVGDLPFGAGSATIHPPLVAHDQHMASPGEDMCVQLRAARPLPVPLRRTFCVPAVPDWLASECAAIAAGGIARGALDAAGLSLRASAALASLAALAVPARERTDAEMTGRDADGAMAACRAFLAARYRDPIGIPELAKHVGLSPDHLRHRFSRTHGMGVVPFLRALRIARAKELLEHAPLTLAEIASMCGFGTDRYFSEIFRRSTGLTPGAYRRDKAGR